MINKYKKLSIAARASLWAFFANIIQKGVSILVTPLFTRLLSTDEFAQFTLYQSWNDIFVIFATLNVFNYATYSAMKEFENDRNGFISTAQTLITGLSLILFMGYYLVHIFLGDVIGFPIGIVILMFLDILFFGAYRLWMAKNRYEFKYKVMTIISVLIGTFGPILGFLAIHYLPNKGYGRIYGVAVVNIIFGLGIYIYNLKQSKNIFNKKYIKFIFAYCLPLIPHFLSSKILTRFDRIMINNMCNASQAGIYGLAYSLSSMMGIINDAILSAYTPWTYQTIKNNQNVNALKRNTNFVILLVAAANIMLILFAPEAIKIFATKDYYEAIYIIPPVSASIYFTFLFNIFANIEYYYSETKYVGFASILAAVTNVVLNFIFINKYGYLAAGYTTLISYIMYAIGHYIFMKKVCKKHADNYNFYDIKSITAISLIFTLISLSIIPFYNKMIFRYCMILIIILLLVFNYKKIIKLLNKKK